jgi:hypothetical protein
MAVRACNLECRADTYKQRALQSLPLISSIASLSIDHRQDALLRGSSTIVFGLFMYHSFSENTRCSLHPSPFHSSQFTEEI